VSADRFKPTMRYGPDSLPFSAKTTTEKRTLKRHTSALGIIANVAWVIFVLCLLAPSVIELSSFARGSLNVLLGLSMLAFFSCAVIGFTSEAVRRRSKEDSAASKSAEHPSGEP
jgi:hypothetical protein